MRGRERVTITLIIPVYNVELYLEQCLTSVVEQTNPFDEVILVNDGSTDKSPEMCKKYFSSFDYFKFINQENKGLSAARNLGMRYAASKYIMFLDSDDYLRKDTVEILKRQLQNVDYDAVFFDADIHCEIDYKLINRNIYDRSKIDLGKTPMSGWDFFSKCYPRNYVVSACMAVYKKDVISNAEIQFPEGRYYEDNYFTFAFINCARYVIHISDKLYQRRYRDHSITISKYSERKFIDFIEIIHFIWRDIYEKDIFGLKELSFAFMSDQCIRILDNYRICEELEIVLGREAKESLKNMMKNYIDLLEGYQCNIYSLKISNLLRILTILHNIKCLRLVQDINQNYQVQDIIEVIRKIYIRVLKELPFNNKEYRVGIYGTGEHTEGLFLIYEKLIGEIVCELVFIDSQRDDEVYKNAKLVHFQRINTLELDQIVISSFIYEQEMKHNIREMQIEVPVYTFYEELDGDIFSNYKIFLEYC